MASDLRPVKVFEARGLSKNYLMGEVLVHALSDIDLDIYECEFVVLLGPSGSRKSTILTPLPPFLMMLMLISAVSMAKDMHQRTCQKDQIWQGR